MIDGLLETSPDAVPGAPVPRVGRYRVNGTTLYAEVRGSGSPILIIPGGAEDAEGWRPVAERLTGHTVVTYDRRGTLRSGRDDWPGLGSAQHADDAAGLLGTLGLSEAIVFGGSSAGIVAVRLALRHSALVRRALVYEPGLFRSVAGREGVRQAVITAMEAYLHSHPGDWVGAYRVFAQTGPGSASEPQGFLTSQPGREWYAQREDLNAEAFVRDDAPILTAESVDELALASCPVDVRFSYGSQTLMVFQDIAAYLASVRGTEPDVIDGVGHAIYLAPAIAATYIRAQAPTPCSVDSDASRRGA